jgi:2-iminobutanoate/2-iminopropanoate deaminase
MAPLLKCLPLTAVLMILAIPANSEPLEYFGKPVRNVPISGAVKVGKFVFVSGAPAFGPGGKLAVGDFPAQMTQVMENLTANLKAAGTGWDRVVKTTVYMMRASDFPEMNRIYSSYFQEGKFPARTTLVVSGLPHPDFLLEIACGAVLE